MLKFGCSNSLHSVGILNILIQFVVKTIHTSDYEVDTMCINDNVRVV